MDVTSFTIEDAATALHTGRIGAEEYARTLLDRAAQFASLNAFILIEPDRVIAQAREADARKGRGGSLRPLHGVPLAIKDNLDTEGMETTGGTPGLRGNVPARNAPVVQRLVDAGAVVFGKANMHELAFGITTNNRAFGPARNPWDPERIAGGSSGGTGVAVSARIVPGGIGSDTGGSVRVPAALCGIVGLRPTVGLWSQSGIVPISHTRDTAGPMTRSVRDCALLHRVVMDSRVPVPAAAPLRGVRLGVPRADFWADLESETQRLCEGVLEALRAEGAVLVEADIADVMRLEGASGFPIALYETVVDLNAYLREHGLPMDFAALAAKCESPDVAGLLQGLASGGAIPEAVYRRAMEVERPALQETYRQYFAKQRVDAVIFPTTPLPAAKIGEDDTVMLNGRAVPTFPTFIRNSSPGSVAGIPGLSLPVGLTSARLPVGIELDGPAGSDDRLLALGQAIEALVAPMSAAC